MAFLDTSVLGSLYCQENLTNAVTQAIQEDQPYFISSMVRLEFHSLISQKTRQSINQGTDSNQTELLGRIIYGLFEQHLVEQRWGLLHIGQNEIDRAIEWLQSFHTSLRAMDALHLATAYEYGQELWTTDRRLAQAAEALHLPYRLIGQKA